MELVLYLLLGEGQRLYLGVAQRAWDRLEPALFERIEGTPQALTPIQEPRLAPQVLQAVRRWRPGQVYPAIHPAVRHLAQGLGPLGSLSEAKALEPGALVGDHSAERPAVAQMFDKPWQVLIVGGVDGCVALQGPGPGPRIAHDGAHLGSGQVVPLADLIGPGALCYAQGRKDQGRPAIDELQQVQGGEHRDRLA